MNKFEQARKALTTDELAEKYCEGFCKGSGFRGAFHDCTGCEIILAVRSPSTSVDGVGAEPVACSGEAHDHPTHEWHKACIRCGVFRGTDLYAAPLASPEAEARLRKRVAELEAELEQEQERVIIIDAARDAAEARLVQADGGPAVTDEMVTLALDKLNGGLVKTPDGDNLRGYVTKYLPREAMRAALEAALHPQSAGEEG